VNKHGLLVGTFSLWVSLDKTSVTTE